MAPPKGLEIMQTFECYRDLRFEVAITTILDLVRDIEAIRLTLVRLDNRNRRREINDGAVFQGTKDSTAKGTVGAERKKVRIDEDGRAFQWVKKTTVPTEEVARKKQRKRPIHRGKWKKKDTHWLATLRRAAETFDQLALPAKHLPRRVYEVLGLLIDTRHGQDTEEEVWNHGWKVWDAGFGEEADSSLSPKSNSRGAFERILNRI